VRFFSNRILGACVVTMLTMSLTGISPAVIAADRHAGHDHMDSKQTAELGMSAAVDHQGRLWIAIKEVVAEGQFVAVRMSPDLGKTWSAPKRIQASPEPVSAEGENRPKIAFGTKGDMFVTYTKPLAKPYTGEIRLVRSVDGGEHFLPPVTVHANRDVITHRFDSLIVDPAGRVYVAWIDKRDLEQAVAHKRKYEGAALYYAISEDGGASFRGDFKIADHSCECCRIALSLTPDGKVAAMWRHVFEPNIRDHAMAILPPDGKVAKIERATFDNWHVDACPHHGPSLAFDATGRRYQTWFDVAGKDGDEGGVFFAAADAGRPLGKPMPLGTAQAEHADVGVHGDEVVIVWKQFDGKSTAILGRVSADRGKTWKDIEFARTTGASDQPHLVTADTGVLLIWRTQNDGVHVLRPLGGAS
jgi:hypothetical protein